MTDGWGISCKIALRWMPLDLTDDKSILVQVMAWCHQATSHYLSQCWPRSMSPYGATRPQWVKSLHKTCVRYNKANLEGFHSCNRPCYLTQIRFKSSIFMACMTFKFNGWPRKTIGHLFYATSSFVHQFKLEWQSRNTQSEPKSATFCPVWPWNSTDDLEKQ